MLARWVIVCANLPAVATAIFSCVFAVWFSKFQDRNVGPSVTYMAFASIALVIALFCNLVFWIALRKRDAELRFLHRVAGSVLVFCVVLAWIENRFSYVGERYALTHSLWSAIRMKDPPLFVPAEAEDAGKTYAREPVSVTSPCLKGCN